MDELDKDYEYFYTMCERINKRATEAQEDDYIARVRELVMYGKIGNHAARIKAFTEVVIK